MPSAVSPPAVLPASTPAALASLDHGPQPTLDSPPLASPATLAPQLVSPATLALQLVSPATLVPPLALSLGLLLVDLPLALLPALLPTQDQVQALQPTLDLPLALLQVALPPALLLRAPLLMRES